MTDKAEARRAAMARRKAAHAAGADLTAPLLAAIGTGEGPVAGYLPIRSEADPTPAMTRLCGTRPVAVPVVRALAEPLLFRVWHPRVALLPGPLGTRHPEGGEWVRPTVLIVPCLAFDRAGYRLGYGGGFYDRTIESLRATGPLLAIGLAYAAQEMAQVPIEPTDRRLDLIVTEAGIIIPGDAAPEGLSP